MPSAVDEQLHLVAAATDRLLVTLGGLTDEAARQPSKLPGWSRGHVVTHVARSGDGMLNLFEWARTGVPRTMYTEPDGRDADIEAGSGRSAVELTEDVRSSAHRWAEAAQALSHSAWQAMIQRRPVMEPEPAHHLLAGRLFEVEFHHADLGLGYGFLDMPTAVLELGLRRTHERLPVVAADSFELAPHDTDQSFRFGSGTVTRTVTGTLPEALQWLTGRGPGTALSTTGGSLPILPPWR